MNIPCQMPGVNCPNFQNSPLLNNSVELPDSAKFLGESFGPNFNPPLGWTWGRLTSYAVCYDANAQEHADICADAASINGTTSTWESPTDQPYPPQNTYFSHQQQSTVDCPDGSPFTFVLPAGAFEGLTQAEADQLALEYAEQQAIAQMICLSPLSANNSPAGQPFSATITANGETAQGNNNTWSIVSGSLPPGLHISGNGPSALISGTPGASGTYPFVAQITDAFGNTMQKSYTLVITGIFDALQWTFGNSFPALNPPGTGGASASGETLQMNFTVGAPAIIGTAVGLANYNGPGHNCNLKAVITPPWSFANPGTTTVNVQVIIGAATLINQNFDTGTFPLTGEYDFPFVVPPGTNQLQVSVTANFGVGGPAAVNMAVQMQQLN